jgi:2-C-methyl-D-erythritol 4-phosphate cytidylyltransferase
MNVYVIIPAAGLGTRMRSAAASAPAVGKTVATAEVKQPSKQFLEVGGVPILIHTLRKFAAVPAVAEICLALRRNEIESFGPEIQKKVPEKKIRLVEGGEHRQQSVANAVAALDAQPDDIVLVHDAVRPFIDSEIIDSVVAAVEKHGAAIVGMPAIDTIKQVERTADGAVIKTTIPREQIVQAQTPQGFRYATLKQAFDEAEAEGFLGTDEASLLERIGQDVHVVMGAPKNLKITTPADLALAEFYLSQEKA